MEETTETSGLDPTINTPTQAPGSRIRDATLTTKATIKDNATDLAKSNIKLYVAGKTISASSFSYDRARNLFSYTSPKLSAGKKTVKIVATDAPGNRSSRTWNFTILR